MSETMSTNIVHVPYNTEIDFELVFGEYIFEQMKKHNDSIAQIDAETGKKETYTELLARCVSLAKALKLKGVTSEDIVGICCYNNMDYSVAIIASIFIGARFCSFNVTAPETEIIHCLKLVKPSILFCEHESEEMLNSLIKNSGIECEIVVFDQSDKFVTMNQLMEQYKSDEEFKIDTSRKMKDTVCICFTSGTSGLSKGAQLRNFGFYYGTHLALSSVSSKISVALIITVPYWVSNISFLFYAVLGCTTRIILKAFDKNKVVKILQDYKVDVTLFTQQMINELNKVSNSSVYDLPSLKYIFFGGTQVGVNQILELKKHFPNASISNGMATTETSGLLFAPHSNKQVLDKKGSISVGRPLPGFSYKVADLETDEPLGPNKKGELRIKFDGMMNGYLNQPDVTAAAFDEDGFYKTGDVIYYDENHNFFIVDRIKEIFKYRAYHISPSIIEDVLEIHPGVQEAAVVSVSHEHDGEIPMAVIVRRNNVTLTEEDLINHVKDKLSEIYQLRGGVKFVDNLPRTGTGKLRRKYLKELILNTN